MVPAVPSDLLPRQLLESLSIPLPQSTDRETVRDWLYTLNVGLGIVAHKTSILRGILLELAHSQSLWEGKADSWREYCEACGLNQYEASRLRTISRFMAEQEITADQVVNIRDTNKLYAIAVRAREKMARTAPEDRPAVQKQVQFILAAAPVLSRQDVMREMDDAAMPSLDPCTAYTLHKTCLWTGVVNPRGCDHCQPPHMAAIATRSPRSDDRPQGGVVRPCDGQRPAEGF